MVIYIGVHWIDGGVRQKENEKGGGGVIRTNAKIHRETSVWSFSQKIETAVSIFWRFRLTQTLTQLNNRLGKWKSEQRIWLHSMYTLMYIGWLLTFRNTYQKNMVFSSRRAKGFAGFFFGVKTAVEMIRPQTAKHRHLLPTLLRPQRSVVNKAKVLTEQSFRGHWFVQGSNNRLRY